MRYLLLFSILLILGCTDQEKQRPVNPTITQIDSTQLHSIILNDSENLRLINIWATWCAPCLEEFPVFVEESEKYADKNFEFIAVSADELGDSLKVLRFLEKQSPVTDSYIFEGEYVYQLIYNEDIGWNGSLPFTVLVEPGGKVIFRQNEAIEPESFRKLLADHPMLKN
jgi:thiol-disulfide isomerase/thioredoxin